MLFACLLLKPPVALWALHTSVSLLCYAVQGGCRERNSRAVFSLGNLTLESTLSVVTFTDSPLTTKRHFYYMSSTTQNILLLTPFLFTISNYALHKVREDRNSYLHLIISKLPKITLFDVPVLSMFSVEFPKKSLLQRNSFKLPPYCFPYIISVILFDQGRRNLHFPSDIVPFHLFIISLLSYKLQKILQNII